MTVRRLRCLAAALAACLLLTAPSVHAAQSTDPSVLPDIEDEVMCPVCGTILELANGPQADRERALIRRLDSEGKSKQEIEDQLVAEYGDDVLAEPKTSGFDLTAWVLPGAGILFAMGALALAALRLRRRTADPEPEQPALDPAETERLETDMSRYRV
jgi:cytochrome c-type biogenesis protein CcmH